jgi:hypothetical protein
MLIAPPLPPAELAPGLRVPCKLIVPVNEFAPDAVFAASLTASSALAGAVEEVPLAPAPEEEVPLAPALELVLGEQPVTAAAAITASPAADNGTRALTCIETSEA